MFWDTYLGLQIPYDQLKPFYGCLVGFIGNQVEVWGYVDMKTNFTDENATNTIMIKYIVLNAYFSYNLLLECSLLNRLGVVVSTSI